MYCRRTSSGRGLYPMPKEPTVRPSNSPLSIAFHGSPCLLMALTPETDTASCSATASPQGSGVISTTAKRPSKLSGSSLASDGSMSCSDLGRWTTRAKKTSVPKRTSILYWPRPKSTMPRRAYTIFFESSSVETGDLAGHVFSRSELMICARASLARTTRASSTGRTTRLSASLAVGV